MRYWILEDDRVKGPFAPEELRALPHFDESSLVYPETEEGGWAQASSVPRLSLLFKPQPSGLLPPEPTLRDLALLGGLLEKTERLEERLGEVQAGLSRRDGELDGLKASLEASAREGEELKRLVEGLAARLEALAGIQEAVSGIQRAESEKAAAIEQLRGAVEALAAKLGSKDEMDELRSKLALLQEEMGLMRGAVSAAPPMEEIAPEPAPPVEEAPPPPVEEPPPPPPEPVPPALLAASQPENRRSRILLSAVIVLLLLLLGAYFAFLKKAPPPAEPPPPVQPAPEPPPVQAAPEPQAPVSAVVPKPAKRKPRPRKAAEKVLTQKEKDEKVKKDIINKIRLRMSGGAPREGLVQEKKAGE
jgi:hypothetical protein